MDRLPPAGAARRARAARRERSPTAGRSNPGEVWEENEFWIELSWRIDPDGSLGIRQYHESRARPGEKLTVDEYYGWMFEQLRPGLPERAAAEGLTPLQWMRRYGAFEIAHGAGAQHEQPVPAEELADVRVSPAGRVYTAAPEPLNPNIVPTGAPEPDGAGRRAGGDGDGRGGAPRLPDPVGPAGVLLLDARGLGLARTRAARLHQEPRPPGRLAPDQMVLLSTFRLPTQIHTRSANSKWLDELAHTNPVWIHPLTPGGSASRATGDLVRVETDIGHFVAKAWLTEGIRPGVVACSHHMGRWRRSTASPRAGGMMATVDLRRGDDGWTMQRRASVATLCLG